MVNDKTRTPGGVLEVRKGYTTRVQGRLQRAIEVWHKMEMDDEKLDIDKTKLEFYRQKILGQYDIEALVDDDDLGLD